MAGEKTEKATPKKRQKARSEGNVAKSADVNTAFIFFIVFLVFMFSGSSFVRSLLNVFQQSFSEYALTDVTQSSVPTIFGRIVLQTAKAAAPIVMATFFVAIAANVAQIGFKFSPEVIKFKPERLNPIQGAKKFVSLQSLVNLAKSSLKILFIGLIAFGFIWLEKGKLFSLAQMSPASAAAVLGKMIVELGLSTAIILIFISILDFVYQRFDYEKRLKMSKQEVKDEFKNADGDPKIKGKIRGKQRQIAMRRMMQEVPQADVIITNPTHFAVALKYEGNKMDAPIVCAKGADYVAMKIKEVAKNNGIVTLENRPLARALYYQTEIGQMIPEEFFKAVAEILAYVYRLKNKV